MAHAGDIGSSRLRATASSVPRSRCPRSVRHVHWVYREPSKASTLDPVTRTAARGAVLSTRGGAPCASGGGSPLAGPVRARRWTRRSRRPGRSPPPSAALRRRASRPGPEVTIALTAAFDGLSWSRFGPTAPAVPADASVWQPPHPARGEDRGTGVRRGLPRRRRVGRLAGVHRDDQSGDRARRRGPSRAQADVDARSLPCRTRSRAARRSSVGSVRPARPRAASAPC